MITAHLPAGYCLAEGFGRKASAVTAAALIGSLLPDADILLFYFWDAGAVHHHRYWPHIPVFWLAIGLPVVLMLWRSHARIALAFLSGIMLHLILDSLNGGILWLWPLDDHLYALVDVPATQKHWVLSFVMHWTFAAEIAIWLVALALLLKRRITKAHDTANVSRA